MSEQAYSVGIGLSVVPYIGPDLYSNVPAVISELIANAWDAGATLVRINIDLSNDTLTIEDDGRGMSLEDINTKYLRIGFKKRLTSETTFLIHGKQRHVMGRKGIGKLAPFALADELEIHSSNGQEKVGCIIKWPEFKSAIDSDSTEFQPIPLLDSANSVDKGTKLILRNIRDDKKSSLKDVARLRKLVARRFTVIDPEYDFEVQIDNVSITDQDRPYLHKLEFIWCLGFHHPLISDRCPNLLRNPVSIDHTLDVNETSYEVTGWVGTVEQPSDISIDGNATIAIFAHGKLVQEDILGEIGERQVFASYVVGDIQANFLDYDDENDIVTPDRQRLNQSDPRYIKLREYVKSVVLSEISKNWTLWRLERSIPDALSIPEVNDWYEGLNKTKKTSAASIFRKIAELKNLNSNEKKRYYKIVADHFNRLRGVSGLTRLRDNEFIEALEKSCGSHKATSSKSEYIAQRKEQTLHNRMKIDQKTILNLIKIIKHQIHPKSQVQRTQKFRKAKHRQIHPGLQRSTC
ncbi:MAG: ATP-binding protein [Caldilineaceae bacterium]